LKKRKFESGVIRKSFMSYYNNDPPLESDESYIKNKRSDLKKDKLSKTSDTKIMKDFINYNKKGTESTK
jgi:hypothetical protein